MSIGVSASASAAVAAASPARPFLGGSGVVVASGSGGATGSDPAQVAAPLAPYRHLLVPVDPAGCAWLVVAHAARLAQACGARVSLLHVVDPPTGVQLQDQLGGDRSAGDVLDAEARAALTSLQQAFPPGVEVDARVEHGGPAAAILGAVERLAPDLVVMGTHGRTGLQRMLMGSVAEHVIRRCAVPVLVVRGAPSTPDRHSPAWEHVADEAGG